MHPYTTLNNTKVNPKVINADFSRIENHAPWSLIGSPELAKILGVHLQTIANWRMRNILPPPEPASPKLRGNVVRYRISAIRAWLEGSSEEQVTWDWIRKHLPSEGISSVEQAQFLVRHCYDLLDVEKPA